MRFLLSGEGPQDIGTRSYEGEFEHGPMTCFIDILVQPILGYSPRTMETKREDILEFCSRNVLTEYGKPGGIKLAGKRYGKNRAFFTANAQVLAAIAKKRSNAKALFVV